VIGTVAIQGVGGEDLSAVTVRVSSSGTVTGS
jgi:hypothetical protein